MPAQRRTTDLGMLLVGAAILFALMIGGVAAYLFISSDQSVTCGLQSVGSVTDRIDQVRESPTFVTGGKDCAYWLDRSGHELVAYKAFQPKARCPLDWKGRRDTYVICGEPVEKAALTRYPTWRAFQGGIGILLVDLRSPQGCGRYDLGIPKHITARLSIDGATRITVPGCGEFWITLDRADHVVAVASDKTDCSVARDARGRLTCDGSRLDPARLPQHPVARAPNGDLAVDTRKVI